MELPGFLALLPRRVVDVYSVDLIMVVYQYVISVLSAVIIVVYLP
jgi:hypothetical protein